MRRLVVMFVALVLAAIATPVAWGFWTPGDAHGNAAASATLLNQGSTPTAVGYGTNVVVSWGTSGTASGRPAGGYIVKRYDAGLGIQQTISGVITATTYTETGVPTGDWKYTITPVIGTNWRGRESPLSGVVETGPTTLRLAQSVFGPSSLPASLPGVTTGTLSGFGPNEGISYELDGTPITGSPSSVGPGGSAAITSLSIPSGLSDGPHTIEVIGNNPIAPSQAQASILVDSTAPTITPFITPAPNAAGWNNTSPVEVNGTVDTGGGSGIAYVKYTDDGTDPVTSPTAQYALTPPIATQTTTYKFYGVDLANNASAVQTLVVKIDTTPPAPSSVTLVNVHGGAWLDLAHRITYYRGIDAGSYQYDIGVTDGVGADASGPASASDSPVSGTDAGFSNDSATITTPPGGPYVLDPISWIAGTTSNPVGTVTLTDVAGNTLVTPGQVINDSAAPSGGSINATGLTGPGGDYSASQTVNLSLSKGSDSGSGLADGSPTDLPDKLMRASAPLSSSNGITSGTCGTYSSYTQVQADNPPSTITDTVPTDDSCYRYQYQVADHVGNIATYTTPDIKVQTAAAPSLTPSNATLTPVTGTNSQSVTGSTIYYNPAQSGSFNVDASASSPFSGIAQMTYPTIAGFTGGGIITNPLTATTFRTTYAWSNNTTSPSPGPQSLSATNNAGQTATNPTAFSIIKDSTGPTGGSIDATALTGTGNRYSTTTTLTIAFSPGTDTGSGLATSGARLLRASAALTSDGTGNGTCGTFGGYFQVGANDPTSPTTGTVPADRTCYRYEYIVSDNVGNQTTYTSPDIKVDTTAPPTPTLTFSNLTNASTTGTTIFYRPTATTGGFTVNASSADTTSGTTSYTFPNLPTGWTGTPGTTGVQSYGWSAASPTPPSGNQNITATNNAGTNSPASPFTVTPDSTAPTGGSITYLNGTSAASTASITFAAGSDAGSGLAASSAVLQRAAATLSSGTCGTFGGFSTIATAPTSPYTDTVAASNCYQYRYLISDNVGNQATYTSANVLTVTAPAPTHALSLASPASAYLNAGNLYYNPKVSGSFKLVDALTAPGSTPASVTYPALSLSGWTHAAETVSTPPGGPFTSSTFSWSAQPNSPGTYTLSGLSSAGTSSNATLTFIGDQSPPSGGSITYPNGIVNTPSVAITTADGTDTQSGVNHAAGVVKRDTTTLNTTTDSCDGFPGTFATTITLVGGADTSASNGHCYQYRYLPSDNVGNVATYNSSNIVKLDTQPKVTNISNSGNGQLEVNDQLVITFSENLAPATVPTTFSGATETRPVTGFTKLTIPGITNGALDTGSNGYLAGSQGLGIKTATFAGTVALNNSGSNTTITLTVTGLSGDPTATGQGALTFRAAPTITGVDGTGSTGTFITSGGFKLF